MAAFSYRAVMPDGSLGAGKLEASDASAAIVQLRRTGARPIAVEPVAENGNAKAARPDARTRAVAIALTGELAVLLNAGLPLDRSLVLAISNVEDAKASAQLTEMLSEVREGVPLSRAMARRPEYFSSVTSAMAEAGEANGALGTAMTRSAEMLERAEDLRKLVATAMIYPISLALLAVGVILLMLLFVVPQFESLFMQAKGELPAASVAVLGASRFLRDWGWWLLAGMVLVVLALRQLSARPEIKAAQDNWVLRVPRFGLIVRSLETARFARTLGVLVEGNVPLPSAVTLARRTVSNSHMGAAIDKVGTGLREGGKLAGPLSAAGILPRMAIGFIRTGEETSELGAMLNRLADVLDRDVRIMIQQLIGILTPLITVVLGASVAAIIASIMSAIIGFNDLAISQ